MVATLSSPAHLTPRRFTPRQRGVLLVLLGAGFVLSADFSILTVALRPTRRQHGYGDDQPALV